MHKFLSLYFVTCELYLTLILVLFLTAEKLFHVGFAVNTALVSSVLCTLKIRTTVEIPEC